MTAAEFANEIADALHEHETDVDVERVSTYEDAGILSYNQGLVVRLASGDEFQITVVQSR